MRWLTGRDYFSYRILATQTKLKVQCKQTCKLCVDSAKHQAGKATKKVARVHAGSSAWWSVMKTVIQK
jgi:hypothetical protein